jgi:signal transduction histidine kinase
MKIRGEKISRLNVIISIIWVVFSFTIVLWWWIFSMSQPPEDMSRVHRMFFWEGLILLPVLFLGGIALVTLSLRDHARHQQLRLFFSHFSHDIKTSISRIRLQAELLEEKNSSDFQKIMDDLNRLDLQLENSLFLAKSDAQKFWIEKCRLSELVASVRPEWPELQFRLRSDAQIEVDQQAFKSILRNIFQNSLRHGHATQIEFAVEQIGSRVHLIIRDNGEGLKTLIPGLGHEMLHSQNGGGNGIGLYLVRKLMDRMGGSLQIPREGPGFQLELQVPGKKEGA